MLGTNYCQLLVSGGIILFFQPAVPHHAVNFLITPHLHNANRFIASLFIRITFLRNLYDFYHTLLSLFIQLQIPFPKYFFISIYFDMRFPFMIYIEKAESLHSPPHILPLAVYHCYHCAHKPIQNCLWTDPPASPTPLPARQAISH